MVLTLYKTLFVIFVGTSSSIFGSTVDLMPTFLEAANLHKPEAVRIDGVSLLPVSCSNVTVIILIHSSYYKHTNIECFTIMIMIYPGLYEYYYTNSHSLTNEILMILMILKNLVN